MSNDKVAYARGRKNDGKPEKLDMDIDRVNKGVTISWLAQAFGMNPVTVKARLRKCPPMQRLRTGYLYDFRMAAPYLVKPVFDVKEYLKTNPEVADKIEQQVRENAYKLSPRAQREAKAAAAKAVDVSAADFDED